MTTVFTVIAAILIFCVLIFVHEFGHFLSAKLLGIRVHEFAIGMGPKLWAKEKGETKYSVRALPIGGYCALEGEDASSDDEKALSNKPAWAKLIVMASGALMNFLLGFLLLLFIFGARQEMIVPVVDTVKTESIAEMAGMQSGDEILRLDGRRIHILADLNYALDHVTGESVDMVVRRQGETLPVTLALPQAGENTVLGINLSIVQNSLWLTLKNGFYATGFYSKLILGTVIDLLRGEIPLNNLSGPVGVVSEISSAVQNTTETGFAGFLSLLNLAVLLTVNLGVFNLLPLPALDGGRIFFVIMEMIRRKPIPPEKEGVVHAIGFALLMLLSLFVAYSDILRLFR